MTNNNSKVEELNITWRPPSLSELTSMVFNTGLTHLASDASISCSYEVIQLVSTIDESNKKQLETIDFYE